MPTVGLSRPTVLALPRATVLGLSRPTVLALSRATVLGLSRPTVLGLSRPTAFVAPRSAPRRPVRQTGRPAALAHTTIVVPNRPRPNPA